MADDSHLVRLSFPFALDGRYAGGSSERMG